MKNPLFDITLIIIVSLLLITQYAWCCQSCIDEIELQKRVVEKSLLNMEQSTDSCSMDVYTQYYLMGCYNTLNQCEEIVKYQH